MKRTPGKKDVRYSFIVLLTQLSVAEFRTARQRPEILVLSAGREFL